MGPSDEQLTRWLRETYMQPGGRQRLSGLSHAIRILDFVEQAVVEFDQAAAEFLINAERHRQLEDGRSPSFDASTLDELFEEGGRLAFAVHYRVETFLGLTRLMLDRLAQSFERYAEAAATVSLETHEGLA